MLCMFTLDPGHAIHNAVHLSFDPRKNEEADVFELNERKALKHASEYCATDI
jgi:hypothetical protein